MSKRCLNLNQAARKCVCVHPNLYHGQIIYDTKYKRQIRRKVRALDDNNFCNQCGAQIKFSIIMEVYPIETAGRFHTFSFEKDSKNYSAELLVEFDREMIFDVPYCVHCSNGCEYVVNI